VKGRTIRGVVIAAVAIAGCGGTGSTQTTTPSAGKGIGYGLRAAGMQVCAGPISGQPVNASYNDQPVPVSLSVYAEPGLATVVVSGPGAQEHAIGLIERSSHLDSAPTASELAGTERRWLRQALAALHRPGVPPGPCSAEAPRLPELAPIQIVCQDELLIPFGRGSASGSLQQVMAKLDHIDVKHGHVGHLYNPYGADSTYTTPDQVSEQRPYCPRS
jgi:hypothetical protein